MTSLRALAASMSRVPPVELRDDANCARRGKPLAATLRKSRKVLLPGCRAGDHTLCALDERHGACSKCGKTIRVTRSSAAPERRRCRDCWSARAVVVTLLCANSECGREFTRRPATIVNDHPCCSLSCSSKEAIRRGLMPNSVSKTGADRATRRTAKARARRLRHAQTWDGIGDEEILDRDGWRCQMPGCKRRPIRKELRFPHPRSRSIDHIVPLSHGGDDTAVNKRAAHLGCNVARGNQVGIEQLPLFGVAREPPLVTRVANGATIRPPKPPRLCECAAVPVKGKKFCRGCLDRRQAETDERRALRLSCRIQVYACRYCGALKVAKGTAQPREVCPARACQLARLMANNLRTRKGMTRERADAAVLVYRAEGDHRKMITPEQMAADWKWAQMVAAVKQATMRAKTSNAGTRNAAA